MFHLFWFKKKHNKKTNFITKSVKVVIFKNIASLASFCVKKQKWETQYKRNR